MLATCPTCASTFEQRRRDQRYCNTSCKRAAKDQRRKPKRLAGDRAREGRDPAKFRNLSDPLSVAARYGLGERKGYTTGPSVGAPTVHIEVDDVIDRDDDFLDLVLVPIIARPPGSWTEMSF